MDKADPPVLASDLPARPTSTVLQIPSGSTSQQGLNDCLALLGHELRTPISALLSGLDALDLPTTASCDAMRTRKSMRRQVNHLIRLVDTLLDLARTHNGKLQLHREPVLLLDVVNQAMEIVDSSAEARAVTIQCGPIPTVTVNVDSVRLTQVLINLLDNAIKYSYPESVVELACHHHQGELTISVRDYGVGIEQQYLDQVFSAFWQASGAPQNGGLGIGLALVKALVEAHDGQVTVRSDGANHGCSIRVTLPDCVASHAVSRPPAASSTE